MSRRTIHKRAHAGEVRELLQAIFVAEILCPSSSLWIFSPWISNIPVIDNRAGRFLHLEPSWPLTEVRLAEVLATLVRKGTHVYIATRDVNDTYLQQERSAAAQYTDQFIQSLKARLDVNEQNRLKIKFCNTLHQKGLLGDTFLIQGSMNFTFSGITMNDEMVALVTDPAEIGQARLAFERYWKDLASSYAQQVG